MAISPLHDAIDVVTYQIALDGDILPASVDVISIKVDHQLNHIPQAIIEISLPDSNRDPFGLSENKGFAPGTPVTISAGYHNRNAVIFVGLVSGQSINGSSDLVTLAIHCEHQAALMNIEKQSATFYDKTNAEIIAQVCEENGIEVETADSDHIYPQVSQVKQTDWDFIVQRAMLSDLLLVCEDDKVMAQNKALDRDADLKLTFRRDVRAFDLVLDEERQLKSGRKKAVQVQAPAVQPAKVQTKLHKDKRERKTVPPTGMLEFQGSALARLNTPIELAGFGAYYSGKQLISGVFHTIEAGEWITTVEIGLDILSYLEVPEEEASPPSEGKTESEEQTAAVLQFMTYDEETQVLLIKDPHENEIRLSSAGISIKSQSDLHLEATGHIFLDAGANVDAKAAADLLARGLKVALTADTSFKAEGQATAELSASGITTVKGSLVKIN